MSKQIYPQHISPISKFLIYSVPTLDWIQRNVKFSWVELENLKAESAGKRAELFINAFALLNI